MAKAIMVRQVGTADQVHEMNRQSQDGKIQEWEGVGEAESMTDSWDEPRTCEKFHIVIVSSSSDLDHHHPRVAIVMSLLN
jgi:hypothetical protein